MKTAVERHFKNEAIVIPVILRHCYCTETPFATIQGLPLNAKPVKDWNDIDEAFLNIVEGIKRLLNPSPGMITNSPGTAIPTPENKLSEIRMNLLTANNYREFRKVKFAYDEFIKNYPMNFEVEDLGRQIKTGINYYLAEEHATSQCAAAPMATAPGGSRMQSKFPLIIIVAIILFILLLIYFIFLK